jgi:hypothetical protein
MSRNQLVVQLLQGYCAMDHRRTILGIIVTGIRIILVHRWQSEDTSRRTDVYRGGGKSTIWEGNDKVSRRCNALDRLQKLGAFDSPELTVLVVDIFRPVGNIDM